MSRSPLLLLEILCEHISYDYLSRNQTHFYLWQVTLTLVSDDKPLVFHGQGWGRRKLDAEQFAAESVLMKLPEVDKMLVIFGWVNISSFPWKFKGGTFFVWSMSIYHTWGKLFHHFSIDQPKTLGSILQKPRQNNIHANIWSSEYFAQISDSSRICGTCFN